MLKYLFTYAYSVNLFTSDPYNLLWHLNVYSKKIHRSETSMEKSKMHPIKSGKSMRMSFSTQKEVLEMPNLIELQKDSYQWFLRDGLKEVFHDIFPI